MASFIVKFMYNQSRYFEILYYKATDSGPVLSSPKLSQGDTVFFEVDESVGGGIVVTFNSGCCFTQESFTVYPPGFTGHPPGNEQTVSASAPKGLYLFTLGPVPDPASAPDTARDTAPRKGRGRPPPWDAKTGDLEVVTDPPRD